MSAEPQPGVDVYNGIPEYDLPYRGMEPGVSADAEAGREVAVWATEDYGTQWTFDTLPDAPDGRTADARAAESDESASAGQDCPEAAPGEELACGHARAYEEDGECLICSQRFNTDEEREVRTAAASDDLEGAL